MGLPASQLGLLCPIYGKMFQTTNQNDPQTKHFNKNPAGLAVHEAWMPGFFRALTVQSSAVPKEK